MVGWRKNAWTQRCNRSYYLPLNASKSGNYRHLPCEDPLCEHGTGTQTQCSMKYVSPGASDDLSTFRRSYGDGSKVSGYHAVTSGMRIPFKQDGYGYAINLKSVTYRRGSRLGQQQPMPIFLREEEEEAEQLPMLVDSGSALIWLPTVIFDPLLKRIDEEIALLRVADPTSNPNINCYFGDMSDVEAVSVTLGFNGGAELELYGDTLFTDGSAGRYVCLGVAGAEKAALGMIAQRNTNVGYDLSNRVITFDRGVCA